MITIISSFFWVSVCVYNEARNQPMAGQIGVAQVVLNRSAQRKQSVQAVITADEQFTWYNGHEEPPIKDYTAFIRAMKATMACFLERLSGRTLDGANLYYNPKKADPYWAHLDRVKTIAIIADHIFMKEPRG